RRQVAGDDRHVLGDRAGRDPADHRHVVGAVDRHADQLRGRAVLRDRGKAVGQALAGAELLDRRLAVVGAIGPVAGGVEACAVKCDWPWSTSVMVSAPLVVRLPATTATSSVTEPAETPPITGTSLVP